MTFEDNLDIFQIKRKNRIHLFSTELKNKGKVDRGQFLAEMDVLYGIRPKTGKEYLETLKNVKKIEIQNNIIVWVAQ